MLDSHGRVKWIADGASLTRNLAAANECGTAIVDHVADGASLNHLNELRDRFPRARRLVVVDACDLKTIRAYLDTQTASEMVYRPLERVALLRSCGLNALAVQKCLTPSRASSPA